MKWPKEEYEKIFSCDLDYITDFDENYFICQNIGYETLAEREFDVSQKESSSYTFVKLLYDTQSDVSIIITNDYCYTTYVYDDFKDAQKDFEVISKKLIKYPPLEYEELI